MVGLLKLPKYSIVEITLYDKHRVDYTLYYVHHHIIGNDETYGRLFETLAGAKAHQNIKLDKKDDTDDYEDIIFTVESSGRYRFYDNKMIDFDFEGELGSLVKEYVMKKKIVHMKILNKTNKKNLVYEYVPDEMLDYIIKNKISLYCDYSGGFNKLSDCYDHIDDLSIDDLSVDDDNRIAYGYETLIIKKRELDKWCRMTFIKF